MILKDFHLLLYHPPSLNWKVWRCQRISGVTMITWLVMKPFYMPQHTLTHFDCHYATCVVRADIITFAFHEKRLFASLHACKNICRTRDFNFWHV